MKLKDNGIQTTSGLPKGLLIIYTAAMPALSLIKLQIEKVI